MLLEKSNFNVFNPNFSFYASTLSYEDENYVLTRNQAGQNERVNNQMLIKLHKIYGNKWKQISNHLSYTSDSFIKNMFYTLARKALRKVNVYIEFDSKTKGKKPKVFKLNFVFKLANLAESQRITDSKENFDNIKGFYTKLLYNLLDMGNIDPQQLKILVKVNRLSEEQENLKKCFESLIENLRLIEKIFIQQNLIKKGRTKKKFPKKGLVQKAYSSKIFKESFEDLESQFSWNLLRTHSKQLNTQTHITQESQNFEEVCQMEALPQNFDQTKDDLDRCLEIKTFDPILFE